MKLRVVCVGGKFACQRMIDLYNLNVMQREGKASIMNPNT